MNNSKTFHRGSVLTAFCLAVLFALQAVCALLPAENPLAGQQKRRLRKRVCDLIWAVGLAVYFLLSFATMAWYITWVVFPIVGAVQGLTMAVWDLKEAVNDEA